MKENHISKMEGFEEISLRNYMFYFMDVSKTAIVRIVGPREMLKDLINDCQEKKLVLSLTIIENEERDIIQDNQAGTLFCIICD